MATFLFHCLFGVVHAGLNENDGNISYQHEGFISDLNQHKCVLWNFTEYMNLISDLLCGRTNNYSFNIGSLFTNKVQSESRILHIFIFTINLFTQTFNTDTFIQIPPTESSHPALQTPPVIPTRWQHQVSHSEVPCRKVRELN